VLTWRNSRQVVGVAKAAGAETFDLIGYSDRLKAIAAEIETSGGKRIRSQLTLPKRMT
jgi:hypothetical protein